MNRSPMLDRIERDDRNREILRFAFDVGTLVFLLGILAFALGGLS